MSYDKHDLHFVGEKNCKREEYCNSYLVMLWNDIVKIFVVWQRLLSDWSSIHIVTVGNGSLSIGLIS